MKRITVAILLALMLMMTVGTSVVLAGVGYVCVDAKAHYVDIGHDDTKGGGRPDITIKTPQGKVVPPDKIGGPGSGY